MNNINNQIRITIAWKLNIYQLLILLSIYNIDLIRINSILPLLQIPFPSVRIIADISKCDVYYTKTYNYEIMHYI